MVDTALCRLPLLLHSFPYPQQHDLGTHQGGECSSLGRSLWIKSWWASGATQAWACSSSQSWHGRDDHSLSSRDHWYLCYQTTTSGTGSESGQSTSTRVHRGLQRVHSLVLYFLGGIDKQKDFLKFLSLWGVALHRGALRGWEHSLHYQGHHSKVSCREHALCRRDRLEGMLLHATSKNSTEEKRKRWNKSILCKIV